MEKGGSMDEKSMSVKILKEFILMISDFIDCFRFRKLNTAHYILSCLCASKLMAVRVPTKTVADSFLRPMQ